MAASSTDFDVDLFERKLQTLKDSQESIQSLSAWCLERRHHHKKIVATWLQVLKKVKVEHRLTLFYLANDVIQYSKRKNFEFVESWGTTLQRATTMVRDEKVKHRILRIFKIWDQRQVYDEEFLADLSGLISAAPKKKQEPQPISAPEEFQAALLISTMRSCATLEQATDARLRDLRECKIDIDNAEELCATLKDRRHVEDAEREVETAVRNVENYVRALEAEIRERTQVLELLEQADQFYETQRGEVKIVTNAYRNFGNRVKNLKKKLDELIPMLVSPIPSPDINAPSPSPDSDIELPGDENQMANQHLAIIDVAPPSMYGSYGQDYDLTATTEQIQTATASNDFTCNFSSFMGGNMDFDMRNVFNDRPGTPAESNQQYDPLEVKPIQVINTRPTENENDNFNISSFLKSVLPIGESGPNLSGGIPGLGLDIPDTSLAVSPHPDYGQQSLPSTPIMSRMLAPHQNTSNNNCQISHSTPLPGVRTLSSVDSHTPSPYSSQNSQSNAPNLDNSVIVNPLPPPPLPPPIFLDDDNCYNKLPPKFPTWAPASDTSGDCFKWEEKGKNSMNPAWPEEADKEKNQWSEIGNNRWDTTVTAIRGKDLSETPESPPIYEKSGFTDPVEYNESHEQDPILGSAGDVDHRIIPIPLPLDNAVPSHRLVKAADVDHRNLISLTGSPANNSSNNETPIPTQVNDALWSNTDQDYRQQVQSGDIVESVDMDMSMSDEENENKQKGRVLVDVRSQDRDMRASNPPIPVSEPQHHHMDMDMRMIPLPGAPPPGPHLFPPPPPPPMTQQYHHPHPPHHHHQQQQPQQHHHQGQPDFPNPGPFGHNNPMEFRPNQAKFHQNQSSGFQQDMSIPPRLDFSDFGQNQRNFHQEFNMNENNHNRHQESHEESRPRYQGHGDHSHRDTFNRNDRGGSRGRGFGRSRRYSDDANNQQWNNNGNNRRFRGQDHHRQRTPPEVKNNRPLPLLTTPLLPPPQNIVLLDVNGMPISLPKDDEHFDDPAKNAVESQSKIPQDNEQKSTIELSGKQEIPRQLADENVPKNDVAAPAVNVDPRSQSVKEPPKQLSEQLEAIMNTNTSDRENLKRPFDSENANETSAVNLMSNGPQELGMEPVVFDYGNQSSQNFRPRGPPPFPMWRAPTAMRPTRGSNFRGAGPRPMWIDKRMPRGPPPQSPGFSPRGMNRGAGKFRGGGFRGRGRAANW